MKTLQNDFTTPKQSKRLLELGVPEWTANCVLRHYNWADDNLDESNWELPCIVWSATELDRFIDDEYDKVLPCWSVGRLIEIYLKCNLKGKSMIIAKRHDPIGRCLYVFENEQLDFSKLED